MAQEGNSAYVGLTRARTAVVTTAVPLLALIAAYWVYVCARLMTSGHADLSTNSYGAAWGIIVVNIVHLIGISHVGIAVSAARLAELVTLVALTTAVINIAVDVGRPERFILKSLLYGRWNAPMVWSMSVIVLYFTASFVYLYLALRRDLWLLGQSRDSLSRLYSLLSWGYADAEVERRRHQVTLFYLGLALVPIMIAVHSVYGFLFGVIVAKPGWYNPLQAPHFVLGAVVSGFSAILVIAGLLRWGFGWSQFLADRVFRAFSALLAFVTFLYVYFAACEHITVQFAALPHEKAVSDALITGAYASFFWMIHLAGLLLPFIVLLIQSLTGRISVGISVAAGLVVNVAMWASRYLIIIPPQHNPHLPVPIPVTMYTPSFAEVVVTLGSYGFAGLLLFTLVTTLPLFEAPISEIARRSVTRAAVFSPRGYTMMVTAAAAVAMTVWGIATRGQDYAPLKWITGFILLTLIPLENCLMRDRRSAIE
jgi:molybdopterin-containing oxidoreductase family membrane subunit